MATGPYDTKREYTIEPGCPWYEAQQSYGPPNVNWCEPTVCSYINEPANTWSNLPLILLGLWLWRTAQKSTLCFFGLCFFLNGLFSFAYHASNNYLTQFIDYLGMFLITSFALSWNSTRFSWGKKLSLYGWFWLYFSIHVSIFALFDIVDLPVQQIIMLSVIPFVAMDLSAGWQQKRLKRYAAFGMGLASLILAQTFAIIDIQRIYCEPDNLILHGHVLWHLLCALSMWFFSVHIRRMESE